MLFPSFDSMNAFRVIGACVSVFYCMRRRMSAPKAVSSEITHTLLDLFFSVPFLAIVLASPSHPFGFCFGISEFGALIVRKCE